MTNAEYIAARNRVVDKIGPAEFQRRQTDALRTAGPVDARQMNEIDRKIVREELAAR